MSELIGRRSPTSRWDLLRRISEVINVECDRSSTVFASRAGLTNEAAVRLLEGDETALTVDTLLAILHAFPWRAEWLITGQRPGG